MKPLEKVLEALNQHNCRPKRSGKGYKAHCPAHNDKNPSLSITEGDDGKVLIKCHAGCKTEDVVAELGLQMSDLYAASKFPDNKATPQNQKRRGFDSAEQAISSLEQQMGTVSQKWSYSDADGRVLGYVLRWNRDNGKKDIRPISLHEGRWFIEGMVKPRPLYNLSNLSMANRIYVTEGEPVADAAIACGLAATTSPHGSKSPQEADWSPLKGKDVVILPDYDDPGEAYAERVSQLARKAGARSIKVIHLSELWPDLEAGGDLVDVLKMTNGDVEAVRRAIDDAIEAVEVIEPETPEPPLSYRPFPTATLPEPIRTFVETGAKAIGCDPSFIALPMLSALAAAIGNTHRLKIKETWIEPAIIWTAIVGESGTAKSPAMDLALRAPRRRQQQAMLEYQDKMTVWKRDHAHWKAEMEGWKRLKKVGRGDPPPEPPKPVLSRNLINDTTTEALVSRLQENPRGLLLACDELSGWMHFDRYKSKAGGQGADVSRWLEVFGGRALTVDRKTSGTEFVPQASVSITGGIQPEILRRGLSQENRDNGLAARLLFAMPPRRKKIWTEDDVEPALMAKVQAVFDWLYDQELNTNQSGTPEPTLVTFTGEAKTKWIEFVNEHGDQQLNLVGDEAAAWSKLEAYAARLALVIHMTRVAAGDPTLEDASRVDLNSLESGIKLVRWFANEAERVYAGFQANEEDQDRRRLIEWIGARGGAVTVRDLTKGLRAYRGEQGKAREDLDALVEAGYGTWEDPAPGTKGGRPTKRFVLHQAGPVPGTSTPEPSTGGIGDGDSGDTSEDDGWGAV
ncbi:MAG: DUF3987 domain-containing protein [Phycisphaeraceae bacterium]